jgi:hypothetical protein
LNRSNALTNPARRKQPQNESPSPKGETGRFAVSSVPARRKYLWH